MQWLVWLKVILEAIAALPKVMAIVKEFHEKNQTTNAHKRKAEKDAAVDAGITTILRKRELQNHSIKQQSEVDESTGL